MQERSKGRNNCLLGLSSVAQFVCARGCTRQRAGGVARRADKEGDGVAGAGNE